MHWFIHLICICQAPTMWQPLETHAYNLALQPPWLSMGWLSALPWMGNSHVSTFGLTSWTADSMSLAGPLNFYQLSPPKICRDLFSNCCSMWARPVHRLPEHLRLCLVLNLCSVTTYGQLQWPWHKSFLALGSLPLSSTAWEESLGCVSSLPTFVVKRTGSGPACKYVEDWDANSGTLVPRV